MFDVFRRLSEQTSFYFLRHGETEGNRAGIVQGTVESPLSELGRAHADAAAAWLSDLGIVHCLTSPLSRARDTARTITSRLGIGEPEVDHNLIELDTGIFSNLTFTQIAERYPDHFRRFQVESWEAVPDAERTDELYARARAVWERLIDLAETGLRTIVCVTHSGTLQWIVKATVGLPEQPWMPLFKMSNCGISLFEARPAYYEPPAEKDPTGADGFFGQWQLLNHLPYET